MYYIKSYFSREDKVTLPQNRSGPSARQTFVKKRQIDR